MIIEESCRFQKLVEIAQLHMVAYDGINVGVVGCVFLKDTRYCQGASPLFYSQSSSPQPENLQNRVTIGLAPVAVTKVSKVGNNFSSAPLFPTALQDSPLIEYHIFFQC